MTSPALSRVFSPSADQQLCLAYTKSAVRTPLTALFAVDLHLERIALGAREPMVARINLAWWREQGFARGAGDLASELAVLATATDLGVPFLCQMVEGWDALLASENDQAAEFASYAEGRGKAFFELAALLLGAKLTSDQAKIGEAWAFADLAEKRSDLGLIPILEAEAERRFGEIQRSAFKALPIPLGILAILARSDATRRAGKRWRAGSPMRVGRAALFAMTSL
jgi:15-cis-phytoene synthase